jgi:uncharacterized protein
MNPQSHAGKHFPMPSPESKTYWEGCRDHRLLLQYCPACSQYQFYPRSMCHRCMSDALEWKQASGRGSVLSFTIVRRPVSQAYAAETPYVIALIQLEEGPTMMSNIVNCELDRLAVGQQVSVIFEDWSVEISIPKFQPIPWSLS